jgi:N-acetylglucosamine-6-phosphate deacetylase
LAAAVQMTSATPARALRLDRVGKLLPGYDANVLLLDESRVNAVMVNGDWVTAEDD